VERGYGRASARASARGTILRPSQG
jgi:hypothetical protein